MPENQPLEILKQAILLERRGNAFYQQVADNAENDEIRSFFQTMADEEKRHMQILADQFRSFQENSRFDPEAFDTETASDVAAMVLNDQTKKAIAAAGFEAAAISAAMSMEEKAIRLYRERGAQTADPAEQALYRWLSRWEAEHLSFLTRLDRELTENVWNDNSFWPF
jgi:rubrerythrin